MAIIEARKAGIAAAFALSAAALGPLLATTPLRADTRPIQNQELSNKHIGAGKLANQRGYDLFEFQLNDELMALFPNEKQRLQFREKNLLRK